VEPGRPVQQRRGGDSPDRPGPSLPGLLVEQARTAGLRLQVTGHRLDVVLADPERRNAQTPSMWRALAAVGAWAADEVVVVVISGEGRSFSAGLDRRAFAPGGLPGEPGLLELAGLDPPELDAAIATFQAGFSIWRTAPFVSVAAVQGHAVGAGFQLALACDIRIAASDARFAMREPALGLVPDLGGTGALVEAVGYARAVEICATARWVDAPEAERIGLVQSVVPADELPAAAGRLADSVLANSAAAVRATVELLGGVRERNAAGRLAAERSAQGDRLRALAREVPEG
jgi:enoyl-CoA hydratase/carnithine racemase